jgi:hypothetical protein
VIERYASEHLDIGDNFPYQRDSFRSEAFMSLEDYSAHACAFRFSSQLKVVEQAWEDAGAGVQMNIYCAL